MMKKLLTASFIFLSLLLSARDNGGYAGSFLRYGLDARSESLSRAVTADDRSSYNFFYNPAALNSARDYNVMVNYRNLSLDRSFLYAGFSLPLKDRAAVALGWLYTGTTGFEARDFDGVQFDTYAYNENMFHLSFALKMRQNLSAGINLKLLYARLPEFGGDGNEISTNSFQADLGAIWKVEQVEGLTVAAAIRDLGGRFSWDSKKYWSKANPEGNKIDKMPTTYDLGFSLPTPYQKDILFNGGVEISSSKNYKIKTGLEYTYAVQQQQIALRAGGSTYSADNRNFTNQLSFGAGYQFKVGDYTSIFDYAFVVEDITPDNPHTLSWRFQF